MQKNLPERGPSGELSMRLVFILILLYAEAANALPPAAWSDNQAKTICALDLRRLYGDTLAVDSFVGKQPHENRTYLIGLLATDTRAEFSGKQVTVGCIYRQDGSFLSVFFNSKIPNWKSPKQIVASAPEPDSATTSSKASASKTQSGDSPATNLPDSDESSGVWTFLIVAIGLVAVAKIVFRQFRKAELLKTYGDKEVVKRIMRKEIWQDQSARQLSDSLGRPQEIDEQVMKTRTREVWKYGHAGGNRYRLRVTLDDGFVVGWDKKGK